MKLELPMKSRQWKRLLWFAFITCLSLGHVKAQGNKVSGKVSGDGTGIPGASVLIKGSTSGTVTDADGNYSINVPNETTLVFSFVGYVTQEINVAGRTTINVVLKEDLTHLSEVIVVGYGTQKKRDLTGSVASIKADEVAKATLTSFEQGLQGKVAGVHVIQGDASPGSGMSIQIRGSGTFNLSGEPLYVVDGIPLSNPQTDESDLGAGEQNANILTQTNILATLSPSDIESIEILKDASATAIYGSRGANGVVLITTKRGEPGKGRIEFGYSIGSSSVINEYDLLGAEGFGNMQNQVEVNSNDNPILPWGGGVGTGNSSLTPVELATFEEDWQDRVYRSGKIQNYDLSFTNRNENGGIAVIGSFLDQEGVITGSRFRRGGLRLNLDNKINDIVTITTNVGLTRSLNNRTKTSSTALDWPGVVLRTLQFRPFLVEDEDLPADLLNQTNTADPFTYANAISAESSFTRIIGGLNLKFNLPLHLSFTTRLGTNFILRDDNIFYPRTVREGRNVRGLGITSGSEFRNIVTENLLTYSHTINQDHALTVLAGFTYEDNYSDWSKKEIRDFPVDFFGTNNLEAGADQLPAQGTVSEWALVSFLGRVNYAFKDKYLLTLTGRSDGSSKFAANDKYAFFPAVAVAWRAADEDFIKDLGVFDDLKLRVSWGESGNQNLPPYLSLAALNPRTVPLNNSSVIGLITSNLPNENLKWETTSQIDIGLDVGLVDNRVRLTLDYYKKDTKDLLQQVGLPLNTGFQNIWVNLGDVENKGFEVSADVDVLDGDFKWKTGVIFSKNENKVTSIGFGEQQFAARIGANPDTSPFIQKPGLPIGTVFGYVEDGIFQNDEEVNTYVAVQADAAVGQIRYADIDGDGVLTDLDRTVIGDVNPDYTAGWNNTFTYKGLDLSFQFVAVQGNDIINILRYQQDFINGGSNVPAEKLANAWSPDNPGATNPQPVDNFNQKRFSDRFVEDGSFIRLRNVQLGYNLNTENISWLQSARIYLNGVNLFTITDYSGYDPEVSAFGNDPSRRGVDYGNTPQIRTLTMGIKVGF